MCFPFRDACGVHKVYMMRVSALEYGDSSPFFRFAIHREEPLCLASVDRELDGCSFFSKLLTYCNLCFVAPALGRMVRGIAYPAFRFVAVPLCSTRGSCSSIPLGWSRNTRACSFRFVAVPLRCIRGSCSSIPLGWSRNTRACFLVSVCGISFQGCLWSI